MKHDMIGRTATIKARPWEWGTIVDFDGEYYHVAIYGDTSTALVFTRDEIRISRKH